MLREEDVKEEKGLFRPNVSRKILVDEGEAINSELTHRSLKRVNIILEAIKTHMVIEEVGVLLRVSDITFCNKYLCAKIALLLDSL